MIFPMETKYVFFAVVEMARLNKDLNARCNVFMNYFWETINTCILSNLAWVTKL